MSARSLALYRALVRASVRMEARPGTLFESLIDDGLTNDMYRSAAEL